MDLYDDLDTKHRPGQIEGWSSGVKLLQTQLALKKVPPPPRKDIPKRSTVIFEHIFPATNQNHNSNILFKFDRS